MLSGQRTQSSHRDISLLPGCEQLRLFRARELSPVEVLKAQIARIEAQDDTIRACVFRHFDDALAAAAQAEARYRRGEARALEGLSVAVKDEYERKGWTVTAGSRVHARNVARDNHPVIDKLLAAGALLHVQTAAPELALIATTWSNLWGVTRNPWNPQVTPGGSSGGSAAALAAGMATLAIGSDMGGSVRIPCALTGLYGAKPAYGRIASSDPSALVPHASPGPLARDFHDLILLHNVIGGPAFGAPSALRPKLELPFDGPDIAGWKIAFSIDQGWARIEPDVAARANDALRAFEAAGAIVQEVKLPLETSGEKLRDTAEKALFSTAIGGDLIELAPEIERLTSYGRRFVLLAHQMGPAEARQAGEETLRLYRVLDRHVFGKGYDALITPTIATTRIAADYDPTRSVPTIDGAQVDPYAGWFLTSLFSLLNWMPVINVPCGLATNGVPTGLQIATAPYEDLRCAAIAAAYARHAPALTFPASMEQ